MSDTDRDKWQRRYAEGSYTARTHPTLLLEEWLPRLARGRALDLACGTGRNALRLAAAGYQVDAMDISSVALQRGAARAAELGVEVNWINVDLDTVELTPEGYDLVVVARYLNRGLTHALMASLRDAGHLLYEQHFVTEQEVDGPRNESFRLRPNELLEMFRTLRVLYYREALMTDSDSRTMALAQLIACKGSPGF
ncbi:MAG: methyltransferase domain-containing protein [Gammaproteobacteria bacterium]|nr:MAG: methyltransferase domain-containing protein [Gammaproteobacteria bacterium]